MAAHQWRKLRSRFGFQQPYPILILLCAAASAQPPHGSLNNSTFVQQQGKFRSAEDKARERFSILDYGADPTGNADSTSAAQACINAAGPNRCYAPGVQIGTSNSGAQAFYKISGNPSLTVNDRQGMYSDGAEQAIFVEQTNAATMFSVVGTHAKLNDFIMVKAPGVTGGIGVSIYPDVTSTKFADYDEVWNVSIYAAYCSQNSPTVLACGAAANSNRLTTGILVQSGARDSLFHHLEHNWIRWAGDGIRLLTGGLAGSAGPGAAQASWLDNNYIDSVTNGIRFTSTGENFARNEQITNASNVNFLFDAQASGNYAGFNSSGNLTSFIGEASAAFVAFGNSADYAGGQCPHTNIITEAQNEISSGFTGDFLVSGDCQYLNEIHLPGISRSGFYPNVGLIQGVVGATTYVSGGSVTGLMGGACTVTFPTPGGTTTATAGSGASTLTVASGTGIVARMSVTGTHIAANTYVSPLYVLGSTTVPLTLPTTGSLSATSVTFAGTAGIGTVGLTGTNVIATGTTITISSSGAGYLATPTTGVLTSNAGATCSGSVVLTSLISNTGVDPYEASGVIEDFGAPPTATHDWQATLHNPEWFRLRSVSPGAAYGNPAPGADYIRWNPVDGYTWRMPSTFSSGTPFFSFSGVDPTVSEPYLHVSANGINLGGFAMRYFNSATSATTTYGDYAYDGSGAQNYVWWRRGDGPFGAGLEHAVADLTGFGCGTTLPPTGLANQDIAISDALSPVVGAALTGGGGVHVYAHCNGSSWVAGEGAASGASGFTGTKTRTACTTIMGGVPSGCTNVTETYVNGSLQ